MYNYYLNKISKLYILFFIFGFLYYWIFPFLFSEYFLMAGFSLGDIIQSLIDSVDLWKYFTFLAFCVLFAIFPFLSLFNSNNSVFFVSSYPKPPASVIVAIFLLISVVYLVVLYGMRQSLFSGYSMISGLEKDSGKSVISGFNYILLFFTVYFGLLSDFKSNVFHFFLTWLLFNSVILLGLGGRLYVISVFITFYVVSFIKTRNVLLSKTFLKKFIILPVFIIIALVVGVLRQNQSVTGSNIIFIFFAESFYAWLGAGHLILDLRNAYPLLEFPYDIFSGIIGLVPTVFYPGKFDFMHEYLAKPYDINAQVGGSSLFFTLLANFGSLGSLLFLYLFSSSIVYSIKRARYSVFFLSFVICLSSLIPFMFFRDGLIIFIKNSFSNILIFPYLTLSFAKLIHISLRRF